MDVNGTECHATIVSSVQAAEDCIRRHEIETTNTFTVFKRNRGVKESILGKDFSSHHLLWRDFRGEGPHIEYNGTPFFVLGQEVRECQFGPDRNKTKKAKYHHKQTQRAKVDHSYNNKGRRLLQPTKKVDCPSKILLKRIVRFPSFDIDGEESEWKRKKKSKLFKSMLREQNNSIGDIEHEEEVHIMFPSVDSHSGHITGEFAGLCQPVDEKIRSKIGELVDEGVQKVSEMKRHISLYCRDELFKDKPVASSRRFKPTDKDVRNHMALHRARTRLAPDDQENLKKLIDGWKMSYPEDQFLFCSSQEGKLLFVHQTKWQRRLLDLYGQDICLLDATYKTSKYSLPLFFICICTNVGYSIVGTFILSDETKSSITEGLSYLKSWNTNWSPSYFMTDFDVSEISAIEETFPGCLVYICDFHREQAWDRWLKTVKNGCSESKDDILAFLRNIAQSTTEEDFDSNVQILKETSFWRRNIKLRTWFHHTWLSHYKRWVHVYRKNWFNARVATTNGIERQHRILKQDYLSQTSDKSLSSLVTVLVTKFLPDSYSRYIEYNVRSSQEFRAYNENIPRFLRNKPKMLVRHCLDRLPPKTDEIPEEKITQMQDGTFHVQSIDTGKIYSLDLENSLPRCSCPDWQKHKLPCKHMLAVFRNFPAYDWDFLQQSFRDAPHFNLDPEVVTVSKGSAVSYHTQDPADLSTQDKPLPDSSLDIHVSERTSPSNLKKCNEILKSIQSTLYNLPTDHLALAAENLEKLSVSLKGLEPVEDGLPLLISPKKRRKEKNTILEPDTNLPVQNLPSRKRGRKKPPARKNIAKKTKTSAEKRSVQETVHDGVDGLNLSKSTKHTRENLNLQNDGNESIAQEEIRRKPEVHSLTVSEIDSFHAEAEVMKIWNQPEITDYIVAKCAGTNVTDADIMSLSEKQWLTDQVIDAYLGVIVEAEVDKDRNALRLVTSSMTSILQGGSEDNMILRNMQLSSYEIIIGAYWQQGAHWDLMIVEPSSRTLTFYNPLGESAGQLRRLCKNWSNFYEKRIHEGLEPAGNMPWTIMTRPHRKQLDGYNCGVYILLFCEKHIENADLRDITYTDIVEGRKRIASHLMMYQVYLMDSCPCCGMQIKETDVPLPCKECHRKFHKKPFCIGEEITPEEEEQGQFTCRQCILFALKSAGSESVQFCEKHIENADLRDITYTDIVEGRKRIASHLMMYQVYLMDSCPCCGMQIKETDVPLPCKECHRKFHKKPFCIGEEITPEEEEQGQFTCRQCILFALKSAGSESVQNTSYRNMKACQQTKSTPSKSSSCTLDDLTRSFAFDTSMDIHVDMTKPFREKLYKKDFSEAACENILDVLKHCPWSHIVEASKEITSKIQPFPSYLPTCFKGLKIIGMHGDGMIDLLPPSLLRNRMYPVDTGKLSEVDSLFAAVSISIWGHTDRSYCVRLFTICSEVLNNLDKKNNKDLIMKEITGCLSTLKEKSEMRQLHLRTISNLTGRRISVMEKYRETQSFKIPVSPILAHAMPLLVMRVEGNPEKTILPLVDACFVGKGERVLSDCYAETLGVCQGKTELLTRCSTCFHKYHIHCIGCSQDEELFCGCNIKRPYRSRDASFYTQDAQIQSMLNQMSVVEMLRNIEDKKLPSLRLSVFRGQNLKKKQMWKDLNTSALILNEAMIQIILDKIMTVMRCSHNDAYNIFLPEILLRIIMLQEGFNRVIAELFMQERIFH